MPVGVACSVVDMWQRKSLSKVMFDSPGEVKLSDVLRQQSVQFNIKVAKTKVEFGDFQGSSTGP